MSKVIKRAKWSEDALVLELRNKNPRAMEYLYEAYHQKIYAFIFYLIKDSNTSQEIMQDVFVKVWTNIEIYNPNVSILYTWIISITRNLCLDKLKSSNFKNQQINTDINAAQNQESPYNTNENSIGIKETLNKLSSEYAELIDLIYYKGYTHNEASEYLNKPLGTIKTNIRYAILELKKIIK
jgi:RNA polymerase sigma-70 factor (ECF subfamily)